MCEWGDTRRVNVFVSADLSHSGNGYWKLAEIDRCIADLVDALQGRGINMHSSCCGHGCGWGHIGLQDGRNILITDGRYLDWPVRGVAGLLRMLVVKDIWWKWYRIKEKMGWKPWKRAES